MLYDMLFYDWEYPLQNMVFSNFGKKNRNYRLSRNKKIRFNVDFAQN